MSLLVIGTIALDNLKTPSGKRSDLLGGSAVHFSMSARFFTKVHLVGIIGEDFPARHIRFLKKKGIDLTSVITQKGKSFRWEGEYKKGDFNSAITLATELGVMLNYSPTVASHQRSLKHVFLANIAPDVQMKLLSIMGRNELVGLDSMNLWIKMQRKAVLRLMKKVDIFVANDQEARDLSRESNLVKAVKALRKMGPRLIVIKKGEHGVLFYCDRFMFSFPAYPVENVIDPTGAGDTFAGGLMGYLTKVKKVNEKNLRKAVIYATTLASFNVEGFGNEKTASLTMKRIQQRVKRFSKFIAY